MPPRIVRPDGAIFRFQRLWTLSEDEDRAMPFTVPTERRMRGQTCADMETLAVTPAAGRTVDTAGRPLLEPRRENSVIGAWCIATSRQVRSFRCFLGYLAHMWFADTARGVHPERRADIFGLYRKPASPATGTRLQTRDGRTNATTAAGLGYAIDIREFRPAIRGRARCGDRLCGTAEVRFVWRVRVRGARVVQARCGDRLTAIRRAEDLEWLFRRYKPAHTELIFSYDEGVVMGKYLPTGLDIGLAELSGRDLGLPGSHITERIDRGQEGTPIDAYDIEWTQRERDALIGGAGIERSQTDMTQAVAAVRALAWDMPRRTTAADIALTAADHGRLIDTDVLASGTHRTLI